MTSGYTLRRATPDDAEALARGAVEGVSDSGEFAPGQVAVLAADATAFPVGDPALAHLRNLFVARLFWGTGVAVALLRAGEQAARESGFTTVRLFVAERNGRARRFYEREGWHAVTEPYFDPIPRLSMVEYRRPLG